MNRAITLASSANCPVYINNVMSKGSGDAISSARKQGRFTVEKTQEKLKNNSVMLQKGKRGLKLDSQWK